MVRVHIRPQMPNYITLEGLKKIKEELEYLKTVKTKEIAELIKHTASFGDLTENAAYTEAKERQGFLQGRILELEERIRTAEVIYKKKTDKIQIGSTVLVSLNKEKQKINIVGFNEANPLKGKISCQSLLGKAIFGKSAGEKVKIKTEGGEVEYKIIKIIN